MREGADVILRPAPSGPRDLTTPDVDSAADEAVEEPY